MEEPNTEAVKEIANADKETTNVTKAALESNDNVNFHESAGHQVKTLLKVTGTETSIGKVSTTD
jgi:hypothetical protein